METGDEEEEVGDEDESADYEPEEASASKHCKSTAVVRVTEEAVNSLKALIGLTSGSQFTDQEVTEKARECAQLQTKVIGAALQGNIGGVAESTGKLMNKLGGEESLYDTAVGMLSVNAKVHSTNKYLKTPPGIHFKDPLKSGMNVFRLVKNHTESEVSGFASAEAPGEIVSDGGALLLMCKIPGNDQRLFSAHPISSTGMYKQLEKDGPSPFNMLVSVQAFLYTKELHDHQMDPKKTIQNGDSGAASGSPGGTSGVYACLGNLKHEYVVPFNPAKDAIKQLEGIMNVIDPYCTIQNINKESRKLKHPEDNETIGFRQFSEVSTKLNYAKMNKKNAEKNPYYMGVVIQPFCALDVSGKGPSKKLNLSFSVYAKSGNGSVQIKYSELDVRSTLTKFLSESIGNPDYLKEVCEKHDDWGLASKFEEVVRTHTKESSDKITLNSFIVKAGSKLYPLVGTGRSTRTDTNNSIHNVLPQTPVMSLEKEGMNLNVLSTKETLPLAMRLALKQCGEIMIVASKFTSLEFKAFLGSIFTKDPIELDPKLFSLQNILDMVEDEELKEPSKAKLDDFFLFNEQDPADVKLSRNILHLTHRALLFYVHCNSPVSLPALVRAYHYFDRKMLEDGDYTKVHEAKEQRYAELLESASFFGCILSHCRSLVHDLIDEINTSIPKKRDKLDKSRMSCLVDFDTTYDVNKIVEMAMQSLNVPKTFDARHIGTYSDKDAFMKDACVMHRFVNGPDGVPMQTIIDEANKEGGSIDMMKTELKDYLKDLIQKTYNAIPVEEEVDEFVVDSEEEEEGGDGQAGEAAPGAEPAAATAAPADEAAADAPTAAAAAE